MCLGIPAKVVAIIDKYQGKVEIGGIRRGVNLSLIEDFKIGDWVIVHAGFAITKMSEEEAQETIKLLKEIAEDV